SLVGGCWLEPISSAGGPVVWLTSAWARSWSFRPRCEINTPEHLLRSRNSNKSNGDTARTSWRPDDQFGLHLVSAHVLIVEVFKPLTQLFIIDFVGSRARDFGVFEHVVFDENRAIGSQGQRQRVAGTRINRDHLAVLFEPDQRVKRVVPQFRDNN